MTNTSINQRAVLQAQIWKIANEVRGAVDGWDFKQFVLGTLFYRFISENFTRFIEGGDKSINYVNMADDRITPQIKDDITKTKGYFIYPSQLFVNIAKNANTNPNLNTNLAEIFDAIENSANGYPSEKDIKGLFADFDTTSNRLGNTVKEKNNRLAAVIKGVEFSGIFYRGGAEKKIRQYLVEHNFVETVISLASNLFYGTSIAVNILVLSKHNGNFAVEKFDRKTIR